MPQLAKETSEELSTEPVKADGQRGVQDRMAIGGQPDLHHHPDGWRELRKEVAQLLVGGGQERLLEVDYKHGSSKKTDRRAHANMVWPLQHETAQFCSATTRYGQVLQECVRGGSHGVRKVNPRKLWARA